MTHSSDYDSSSTSHGKKYIVKPKFIERFDIHSCKLIDKKEKQLKSFF